MNRSIITFLLLYFSITANAQNLKAEQIKAVSSFIYNVKNQNVEELSNHILYPLKRPYPLSEIKDKTDFRRRYKEIFDNKLVEMISNSKPSGDWSSVGWRGIMLLNGVVWLDDEGKLISINYQSDIEKRKIVALIKLDKSKLYPSLRNFETPVHVLKTAKYRIRIDDLGKGNYRYSSWPIKSSVNSKPSLVVTKGAYIPDGSGGNHIFRFKNLDYTYDCHIIVMGERNHPPAKVLIYKGVKLISSSKATL